MDRGRLLTITFHVTSLNPYITPIEGKRAFGHVAPGENPLVHGTALQALGYPCEVPKPAWILISKFEGSALTRDAHSLLAGRISHVRGSDSGFRCPYIRCAWSAAKEEDLVEGMRRVATVLRSRRVLGS